MRERSNTGIKIKHWDKDQTLQEQDQKLQEKDQTLQEQDQKLQEKRSNDSRALCKDFWT
jgi:flagellar biosynthesis chaperone FliJ